MSYFFTECRASCEFYAMRKPVLLISINAIILIIVFALLAQSLLIVSRVAQADGVQGKVEVQRGGKGQFLALKSGQTVAVGDVVRTGKNGQVDFTWADKTRWKLMPQTQLIVAKATRNSAKNVEESQFRLNAGKLFVRIVKPVEKGSSFEVRTPHARAWVVGTVFSVEVKPNGATRVETFAGRVQMESEGQRAFVEAGYAATVGERGVKSIVKTKVSGANFRNQFDLVQPNLNARVQPMSKNVVIVKGTSEAGNTLAVNGQRALMLGNGSFARRFTLVPGHNQWQIVATDKHGVKSSVCRALDYNASTDTTSASVCR